MAKKPGKKPDKRTISVNMEGVEAGGKSIPDGTYPAEIIEVTEEESSNGNEQLKVVWQFTGGSVKGSKLFDWISLVPQALWRLRGMLETIGVEVPDGVMNLDLDDLVGGAAMLEVTNEPYNGKKRPKVTGYASIEADEETAEDEESEETESEDESEEAEENSDEEAESEDESEESEEEASDEDESEDEAEEEEAEEEEEKPKTSGKKTASKPEAKPAASGKAKLKVGAKVKFKNDKGKTLNGVVQSKDGDTLTVEDTKGEEWELDASEVELA